MGKEETVISDNMIKTLRAMGCVAWKNVSGVFSTRSGKRVRTGLAIGVGDIVGFVPVVVTKEMVGQTVALFLVVEAKTKTGGNGTIEQKQIIDLVNSSGGLAFVGRCAGDVVENLKKIRVKGGL